MKLKVVLTIIGSLVIVGGLAGYYYVSKTTKNITNYKDCVAAGHPILTSYPEQCVAPSGKSYSNPDAVKNQYISLEGTIVCLLPKDPNGPHTLECAVGLRTDDGNYYAVKNETHPQLTEAMGSNRRVRVEGHLSDAASDRYQQKGVITVANFVFL